MTYVTAEARQELLQDVAAAIDKLSSSIAALGAAYELLDEQTADTLEEQLFRPAQLAYGRLKRTYSAFATRYAIRQRDFAVGSSGRATSPAADLIERAVGDAEEADALIAELQDSLRPVEVGDPELRAGLAEVRMLLGTLPGRARQMQRVLGR